MSCPEIFDLAKVLSRDTVPFTTHFRGCDLWVEQFHGGIWLTITLFRSLMLILLSVITGSRACPFGYDLGKNFLIFHYACVWIVCKKPCIISCLSNADISQWGYANSVHTSLLRTMLGICCGNHQSLPLWWLLGDRSWFQGMHVQ
jgi:hypothetical protein